jgi:shikimate dehydrogenase
VVQKKGPVVERSITGLIRCCNIFNLHALANFKTLACFCDFLYNSAWRERGTFLSMASSERQGGILLPSVNGKTRILGVFGYPVEHSLSPAMHNAAIAALGLNYLYIPFSVLPEDIGPAIRSIVALGIIGVNLTIPHKECVLPYLDSITPEAQAIGAVNTVHNDNGRLVGYNTDGEGFAGPLKAIGFSFAGKRAVVWGAGGASRSVVFRLAQEEASVTLVNRTRERADRIAHDVAVSIPSSQVSTLDINDVRELTDAVSRAELLVNTTSVGMSPYVAEMPPIPLEAFHPSLFVYDLIYNPFETRLLATARDKGCQVLNGAGMLAYQGAAAFEKWTGVYPDVRVMENVVINQLSDVRS